MIDKEFIFIATGIPPNTVGISGGDKRWIEFLRYNLSKNIISSVITSLGGIKVLKSQNIYPKNIINFFDKKFFGRISFFFFIFQIFFFLKISNLLIEMI